MWRVKNGARNLPARSQRILPDASAWVMLQESGQMLARRRKTCGDKTLPRLAPTRARLIEFTVTSRDRSGRVIKTSRYRVLTTLLDHRCYPADQIAALYAERWQRLAVSAAADLITAIAGQPFNHHDRQPDGPCTPAQRKTEHTRDVTYEITTTPPEPPKATTPAKV